MKNIMVPMVQVEVEYLKGNRNGYTCQTKTVHGLSSEFESKVESSVLLCRASLSEWRCTVLLSVILSQKKL